MRNPSLTERVAAEPAGPARAEWPGLPVALAAALVAVPRATREPAGRTAESVAANALRRVFIPVDPT